MLLRAGQKFLQLSEERKNLHFVEKTMFFQFRAVTNINCERLAAYERAV